jgi:hypothetical protein
VGLMQGEFGLLSPQNREFSAFQAKKQGVGLYELARLRELPRQFNGLWRRRYCQRKIGLLSGWVTVASTT